MRARDESGTRRGAGTSGVRSARLASKLVVGAVVALGIPAGLIAASATASVAASTRTATSHTSAYCAAVTAYTKDETNAFGKLTTPGSIAATMKAAYATLKTEEPKILAIVPSSLKGSYQTVFVGANTMYGYLAAANYNFLKLSPTIEKKIEALGTSLEGASNKISAYNKTVCGAKTP
jgi:hypothetical protein